VKVLIIKKEYNVWRKLKNNKIMQKKNNLVLMVTFLSFLSVFLFLSLVLINKKQIIETKATDNLTKDPINPIFQFSFDAKNPSFDGSPDYQNKIVPIFSNRIPNLASTSPRYGELKLHADLAEGKVGQCLNLDGQDDFFITKTPIALNQITNQITLQAWIYPTALGSNDSGIISMSNSIAGQLSFKLNLSNGKIRFVLSSNGADRYELLSNAQLPLNQWTHVAAVSNGSQIKLFINKVLDSQTTGPSSIYINNGDLLIGAREDNNRQKFYFSGKIDEVFIYNKSREFFKKFLSVAPTKVKINQPFSFHLATLNENGYPISTVLKTFFIGSTNNSIQGLPSNLNNNLQGSLINSSKGQLIFKSADDGMQDVTGLICTVPGPQRIIFEMIGDNVVEESNPIICEDDQTNNPNIYWGDTHWHSNLGFNPDVTPHASESPNYGYEFARDVTKLDFTGMSEHDFRLANPTTDWQTMINKANNFYNPGNFVTFLGNEWGGGPGDDSEGHHSILFPGTPNMPYQAGVNVPIMAYPGYAYLPGILKENISVNTYLQSNTLAKLWNLEKNYSPIMIPHHLFQQNFDLGHRTELMTPAVEIYSKWGSSEFANNLKETAISQSIDSSKAQTALLKGNKMGFIGGSDSHNTVPGAISYEDGRDALQYPESGLTAVLSDNLTREGLWQAIINRHTYATSGSRIYLDFKANGHQMGDEFSLTSGEKPQFQIKVSGVKPIEQIVLVKGVPSEFKIRDIILYSANGTPQKDVVLNYTDNDFSINSFYYLRVTQMDQQRAWSSPVWVNVNLQ
jgi:hypothetical protein